MEVVKKVFPPIDSDKNFTSVKRPYDLAAVQILCKSDYFYLQNRGLKNDNFFFIFCMKNALNKCLPLLQIASKLPNKARYGISNV